MFQKKSRSELDISYSLSAELEISGSLIWLAITKLGNISFYNKYGVYLPELAFMFFYNASQGIERIQKIIIELLCKKENKTIEENDAIWKLLYGHNHMELNNYIKEHVKIVFDKETNKFLESLCNFYNNQRYGKFLSSCREEEVYAEFYSLLNFGKKYNEGIEENSERLKSVLGQSLGILSHKYYEIIRKLCYELGIFAYETQCDSECRFAFYGKNNLYHTYKKMQLYKKEVLYSLIKNPDIHAAYKYFEEPSIGFDPAFTVEYLEDIVYDFRHGYFDEIETIYEERYNSEDSKKRTDFIDYILTNYVDLEDYFEE